MRRAKGSEFRLWAGAAMLWLAVCAGAVSAALLGLLSIDRPDKVLRSPVEIEHAFIALVAGQAFFLVFLWPLFEHPAATRAETRGLLGAVTRLTGLLLLSAPLVLVARQTSSVGAGDVLRSQALLWVGGVAVAAALRLPGARAWYYPAACFLSGVVPLAAYLLREEGELPADWAAVLSPLWATGAAAAGATSVAALILFATLAAGAVLLGLFLRPSPP